MKVKPLSITAYAIARNARYTVRVSVTMGAIPTVPMIIKYGNDYYVRTSTSPLEYSSATFGKAVTND